MPQEAAAFCLAWHILRRAEFGGPSRKDGPYIDLGEFGKEGLHFGTGVGIAFAGGDGDAGVQDGAGLVGARLLHEELRVHEVVGDVFDVALEKLAEVEVGARSVSRIGTLEGKSVAGESVVGFF